MKLTDIMAMIILIVAGWVLISMTQCSQTTVEACAESCKGAWKSSITEWCECFGR